MGYWSSDEEGHSFTGDLTWGDAPADAIDEVIEEIVSIFLEDVGRPPTKAELLAGFKFSWNAWEYEEPGLKLVAPPGHGVLWGDSDG